MFEEFSNIVAKRVKKNKELEKKKARDEQKAADEYNTEYKERKEKGFKLGDEGSDEETRRMADEANEAQKKYDESKKKKLPPKTKKFFDKIFGE